MKLSIAAGAALSYGSIANAAITKACPAKNNICYSLNIPNTTAQSGTGDIYFQISAPSTYQWVALGQGTSMPGSNIFVMYSSSDGQNVTISPRLGTGFVMPMHDTSADITLLAGSGISNGMMTANVKCSNCDSWNGGSMDFTSSSASWIWGYKSGSALDSDDPSESISKHDDSDSFTFDFTTAKGGADTNPFVASSTSSTSGGSPAASSPATVTQAAGSNGAASSQEDRLNKIRNAHGIAAAVAFLILFPLGGVLVRVASFRGLVWVHAGVQLLAYAVFIAALGLGVYYARNYGEISGYHPVIGLVVFALLGLQPLTGALHHQQFRKYGRRTVTSFLHLGVGRIAIVLGIANGFLGLRYAGYSAPLAYRHAYLALAVIALVAYVSAIAYGEFVRAKKSRSAAVMRSPSSGDDVAKLESRAS